MTRQPAAPFGPPDVSCGSGPRDPAIDRRFGSLLIGSDKRQIAHITIWIADVSYFAEVTAVWTSGSIPRIRPCEPARRSGYPTRDLKVEMIVVAHAPPNL
jgi:hypothetical protein